MAASRWWDWSGLLLLLYFVDVARRPGQWSTIETLLLYFRHNTQNEIQRADDSADSYYSTVPLVSHRIIRSNLRNNRDTHFLIGSPII